MKASDDTHGDQATHADRHDLGEQAEEIAEQLPGDFGEALGLQLLLLREHLRELTAIRRSLEIDPAEPPSEAFGYAIQRGRARAYRDAADRLTFLLKEADADQLEEAAENLRESFRQDAEAITSHAEKLAHQAEGDVPR